MHSATQFHGSGQPLDVGGGDTPSSDPVHSHSGTSVPPDADVKAAREGDPQVMNTGICSCQQPEGVCVSSRQQHTMLAAHHASVGTSQCC